MSSAWKQRNAWYAAFGDEDLDLNAQEKENDVPRSVGKTLDTKPLKPANKQRNKQKDDKENLFDEFEEKPIVKKNTRAKRNKKDAPLIQTKPVPKPPKRGQKPQNLEVKETDDIPEIADLSSLQMDEFEFVPSPDEPIVKSKPKGRKKEIVQQPDDFNGLEMFDDELSPLSLDSQDPSLPPQIPRPRVAYIATEHVLAPVDNSMAQDLLAEFGIQDNLDHVEDDGVFVDDFELENFEPVASLSPIVAKRKSEVVEEGPVKRRVGFAVSPSSPSNDSLPSHIRHEILAKQRRNAEERKKRRRMRTTMVLDLQHVRGSDNSDDENKPPEDYRNRRGSIMVRPIPDLPREYDLPNIPEIELPVNVPMENPFLDNVSSQVSDGPDKATLENTKRNARLHIDTHVDKVDLIQGVHHVEEANWDVSSVDEPVSPVVQALSMQPTPHRNHEHLEDVPSHYIPALDLDKSKTFKVHEDEPVHDRRRSSIGHKLRVVLDHSRRSIIAGPEDVSIVEQDEKEGLVDDLSHVLGHPDKSVVAEYSKLHQDPFAFADSELSVEEAPEVQEAALHAMNKTLDAAVRTILQPQSEPAHVSLVGLKELVDLCDQVKPQTKRQRNKGDGVLSWSQGLTLQGQHGTYDLLAHMRKLAEATYSEVYTCAIPNDFVLNDTMAQQHLIKSGGQLVVKIMPFTLEEKDPNQSLDEELDMLSAPQVWSEIACTKSLAALPGSLFGGFLCARVVRGHFPAKLLKDWDKWDKNKYKVDAQRLQDLGDEDWEENAVGSENVRPDCYDDNQLFALLVMPHGGTDLESFEVTSWKAARSIWSQIVLGLAIAEEKRRFEHRDLHWGNVLVAKHSLAPKAPQPPKRKVKEDKPREMVSLELHGLGNVNLSTDGVIVRIIDYTLGRFEDDGRLFFNPLHLDPSLFEGPRGDAQFDAYRHMKSVTRNKWHEYHPLTNVIWLHYLAVTLLKSCTATTAFMGKENAPPQEDGVWDVVSTQSEGTKEEEEIAYRQLLEWSQRLANSFDGTKPWKSAGDVVNGLIDMGIVKQ